MTDISTPTHTGFVQRESQGEYAGRLIRCCKHCQLSTNYHVNKRDMFREWQRLTSEQPTCHGYKIQSANDDDLPPEQLAKIGKDFDLPDNPEKTMRVMRVLAAPLDKLLKSGKISTIQHEAGTRLRGHFERGSLTGSSADYTPRQAVDTSPNPDSMHITDTMIDNQRFFYTALNSLERRHVPFVNYIILAMPISETQFPPLEFLGRSYCGWRNKPQAIAGATDTTRAILGVLVRHFGLVAKGGDVQTLRYFGEKPDHFAVHE